MADTTAKPWGETKVVGKPLTRVDGYERVSGRAVYPMDMTQPDMLHAAVLRCPHAHAQVKKIDLAKAREMPGVRAVLTDADAEAQVPWYATLGPNPRFLSRLFDAHCRHEGEEVAAVAAETPQQAWDAVRAIQVEYQTLPFVSDMESALKPGAPAVHEGGNLAAPVSEIKRGDVAQGFAEADVVLEETYRTSCELHTCLEVHGSLARWDDDELTVWDTNSGPFDIQTPLAAALRMPLSKVRVITSYMGGGFGSKNILSKNTVIAALLARKAGRPVKLFLSREETFLAVGNRPAHILRVKAGVRKDGTLTALQLNGIGEVGAYPAGTSVGYLFGDLYQCPNVSISETQAFIHAGENRAFRAPGFPQGAWALEQMMDALADKLAMDPVEFRLQNIPAASQMEKKPYTSHGLRQCLTEGARVFGWKEARARAKEAGPWLRGVGVASGMWGNQSGPPSTVIVEMYPDGSAKLNMGATDIGTGTKTIMAQVVSEELGVPLNRIHIECSDTGTTLFTRHSGGSKTVFADSPAVRSAALEVKARLLEMAAGQLKVPLPDLVFEDGAIQTRDGSRKVAVTELNFLRAQRVVVGVGARGPDPVDKVVRPFVTHFAEVEVNRRTGEIRVLRMVAANDSGRVMNLLTYRNQVWGGLTMGIGFAMTEQRILDPATGKMVNANWHDYKIPTAGDMPPDLTSVPIDMHDTECNTTGTKGIGEPALVPAPAAIANAVSNATGIRFLASPITAAQVLDAMAQRQVKG